jgi:hypothetical protein
MATKTLPPDPVAELEAAEAALSAVHTRIGAGDPTVTVSDLQHAEGTVRFARVRLDAAIGTEAQQHEQAQLDRVAKIRARLPAIFDTSLLDAAHQALVEALDAYCREAGVIERCVAEVYNELIRIPLSGITVESSAWTGVAIDGHRKPHFNHQVANAVAAAFRRHNLLNDQGGRENNE